MNGPFASGPRLMSTAVPAELDLLAPAPLLLPGESRGEYDALQQMIFADIAPQSAIEWLLAADVAELSWEIRRYRLLRHKLLDAYRHKAIEACLRHIDVAGVPGPFKEAAQSYTAQNALSWRFDPVAAAEIDDRLSTFGFDRHSITMEVYLQVREQYLLFETLINAAYFHRTSLLREISNRRCAKAISRRRRLK